MIFLSFDLSSSEVSYKREQSSFFSLRSHVFQWPFWIITLYYSRSIEKNIKIPLNLSETNHCGRPFVQKRYFLNLRSKSRVVDRAQRDALLQKLGYIGFCSFRHGCFPYKHYFFPIISALKDLKSRRTIFIGNNPASSPWPGGFPRGVHSAISLHFVYWYRHSAVFWTLIPIPPIFVLCPYMLHSLIIYSLIPPSQKKIEWPLKKPSRPRHSDTVCTPNSARR